MQLNIQLRKQINYSCNFQNKQTNKYPVGQSLGVITIQPKNLDISVWSQIER